MPTSEEVAKDFLERSVREFRIFIDTCSILSRQADVFWTNIVPILQREGKSLIVPYRVYEEVKKFADNPVLCAQKKDEQLNQRARSALTNLVRLQRAKIVDIYGDSDDNFADNIFLTVFTQFRLQYNLMLITQDRNLASDIVAIGKSKSAKTEYHISVRKISRYGYLTPILKKEISGKQAQIPDNERFAIATQIEKEVSGNMTPSSIPSEGDNIIVVYNGERKTIKLVQALASGGEGTIFTTSAPGFVGKIYKAEKINKAKFEKLSLMMTKTIKCDGVCFPVALLYNQKNEFVGYLMKQARGRALQHCVFIPQLLKKVFPKWTKVDTVTLCVTILKKLQYLHERNVILGDINPNNILVVSPTEVYFVDADSYQIEGFPCPVGTINFTAPEIQRTNFSGFLRTRGNENFAVATLLFMIMLPGKPPYSLQGGENQIDNIINGDFAYPLGEKSTGKAPQGMWRFCWSHLPVFIKSAFYETFRKGEKHSEEQSRYNTSDWLRLFESYLKSLEEGRISDYDAMSMYIFPTRLKKHPQRTYIRCRLCGEEVEEDKTKQGICKACLNEGEIYHCAICGREMFHSNYQKHILLSRKYIICKDCDKVYTTVRCPECGVNFDITYEEKLFFEKIGFQLPKRCKNCRRNRS